MKKTIILSALCLALLLAACGAQPAPGAPASEPTPEPDYLVLVTDDAGLPVPGAMVQFCSDTECLMGTTDETGVARFAQGPGQYTVHVLKAPEGYLADDTEYAAPDTPGVVMIVLHSEESLENGGSFMGIPNPWSEVESAELAARGAGLDSFQTPEEVDFLDGAKPIYRCMEKMAEAIYSDGTQELLIRKGLGEEDVSGDYGSYPETRTIRVEDMNVQCSGTGETIQLARWSRDGSSFSLGLYSEGGETMGLSEEQLRILLTELR